MSSLNAARLKQAFKSLGRIMLTMPDDFKAVITQAQHQNAWFSHYQVEKSVLALGNMLEESALDNWFRHISAPRHVKKVGLILAGNIPLVGFHDVLCVLASGHHALIKMSSSDKILLPFVLNKLIELEPELANFITYTERLKDFDAIIATGSNNSSRYFEYYFGKVPHIIRKNRNSIAVLDGNESSEDLKNLGHDIFDYFGLGCRNVSKIYIPEDYDIHKLFEALESFKGISDHFKYQNNYDYNKSIYLVNSVSHFDNGFLLLKEDKGFSSPLAVLYYETYTDMNMLERSINASLDGIQCIISNCRLQVNKQITSFGASQYPRLWDYADDMDTIRFLAELK